MSRHLTMFEHQGASTIEVAEAPSFTSHENMSGWKARAVEDAGIFMFQFAIEPNAVEYPVHTSDEAWLAYVVSGHGTLYAGDANGNRTQGVDYRAGDFITFKPNTPHGWKNGDEKSQIAFVKTA
ncbi:cupin domain-containing protein [Microbulbifer agarilyticus]|uniref:cupin domain-containing protein n=1 Tax=Microbulbifer agarilyticus TaxID=260552 RepID=UPI001C93F68C|nr:cupin domain-containing protein [Microbulbifer agarilyticus]MBY6188933.1 cupin domain-containing protein [Microbulbifer agarilyticus]